MKTISDLHAIIPTLVKSFSKQDHEIDNSCYEQDEDGYGRCCYEPTANYFLYDENGWLVEVSYQCYGTWSHTPGDYLTPSSLDLVKAWGEVTELTASYYDEEADEEISFEAAELRELWKALDKELENIS